MIFSFQKSFGNKRIFDPNNSTDLDCFKRFLKDGRWDSNGCPFVLENPYLSIPHMIQDKMVKKLLGI